MEVIHESSKCFWKSKCTLDVCIILHRSFDVLEIVAFEPNIAVESSRIFVDRSNLAMMINENEVHEQIKKLKEPFLRRKEVPDERQLATQARSGAMAELIMNRLHIETYSLESQTLQMAVVETVCDVEKGRPGLVCPKPPGLQSFRWLHISKHTTKDVAQSMEALDDHLAAAKKNNVAAAQYQQTARSALTVRQRWRVALVFGKVSKGRRLSAGDTQIWAVISQNLHAQDLEPDCSCASLDSSFVSDQAEGGTVRLHSLAAQRRRRSASPVHGQQRPKLSPRQLSPREAVANHVQSLSPRSYSVAASPRHETHIPGVGADGIASSLGHSLGSVPGASLDTRTKHYRVAAGAEWDGVNLKDESGDATPAMHSTHSRPASARTPRLGLHSSSRDISPHNSTSQLVNPVAEGGTAEGTSSRPQSATPTSHRSMRARSPISRIPSQDAVDAPPAMKRKLSKQSQQPAPPPSACELANKQLLATRMLKSLAAATAAIRTSIRASFGNDKTRVYAEAAAAAAAAVDRAEEKNVDFRKTHKPASTPQSRSAHLHSGASAAEATTASNSATNLSTTSSASAAETAPGQGARAGAGGGAPTAPARPSGGFGGGGFLSVDVIRSMVRRVALQPQ